MSGWIKVEKDLRSDPRFMRMVKGLRNADVTQERISPEKAATQVLGGLVTLWCYADSHIREDDTLDLGADEINELVGLEGFVELMPVDWLEVINEHCVKLPGFQEHNGTDAKKRALTAKRVERHRIRNVTHVRSDGGVDSNAGALPDQTRPDQTRPDQTRPEKNPTAAAPPGWFAEFRRVYPQRSGDQSWRKAERAANARVAEGHDPAELIAGASRYAEFCRLTEKTGTEFVKQAATFLGPDKPFLQPWSPPATKADKRLAGNISAAEEFMRRTEVA